MKNKTNADDTAGGADQPKKSKGMMIALIAGGALLLTCCCCSGGGAVIYYYVLPKAGEAAIVGVWRTEFVTFDFRADGKLKRNDFDLVYKFVNPNTIEIGPDKQGNNQLNGKPYPTSRYRVDFRADTLTPTEVSTPPPGEQPEVYNLKRS